MTNKKMEQRLAAAVERTAFSPAVKSGKERSFP